MATAEDKIKADALLAMGEKAQDVANKLGLPYATVQSWKRRMEKGTVGKDDVNVVVDVDLATLHTVATAVKEKAPVLVAKKIDKLVEGVTSLQMLDNKFHAVVINLLEAAEEMSLRGDLSVKDWSLLSAGIGSLYASIFNKAGVNVNVNNQTNISSEKLNMFRGTMRSN